MNPTQQNETLLAFGKALLDHVANPQQVSAEQVRMKHESWTQRSQEAAAAKAQQVTVYEELHEAPRKQAEMLYQQYLQEKQEAYEKYQQTKTESDRRRWLRINVPAEIAAKGVHHDFVFTTDRLFNKSNPDV